MNNKTIFVKPLQEVILFPVKPYNRLPKEGAEVPRNAYWLSLARDHDVLIIEQALKAAE